MKYNRSYSILVLFVVLFVVSGCISQIGFWGILVTILFHIGVLLVPGMALQSILDIKHIDKLSFIFSSYIIGYAMSIIVYAIFLLFSEPNYIKYYSIVVLVFSVLYCYRKKQYYEQIPESIIYLIRSVNIILFVAFFIGLVFYQIPNLSPLQTGYWDTLSDSQYYLKCCLGATKSFPIPDSSFAGTTIHWHVFSCMGIALQHVVTGIDLPDLCFRLSYIWNTFMLLGSVYVVARFLMTNHLLITFSLIAILFCSGVEWLSYVYYIEHMYACTLGCTIAASLMMASLFYLIYYIKTDATKGSFLLSLLMLAVCTGAKAPYGAITTIALTACLLFSKCKKRLYQKMGLIACVGITFCIVMYIFVLKPQTYTSTLENQQLALSFDTALRSPIGKLVYNKLLPIVGPVLALLLSVLFYTLNINVVATVLLILSVILLTKFRYLRNSFTYSFFISTLCGLFLFLFLAHPGFSQVYFVFTAIPLAIILFFLTFDIYLGYNNIQISKYKKYFYILLVIGVFLPFVRADKTFFIDYHDIVSYPNKSEKANSVSKDEFEGLLWAKEKLPHDIIFVTNKNEALNGKRSCVTSVLSERTSYIEGYEYLSVPSIDDLYNRLNISNKYYTNPDSSIVHSLKREGVTHSFHYKNISDIFPNMGKIIFENKEFAIIEL